MTDVAILGIREITARLHWPNTLYLRMYVNPEREVLLLVHLLPLKTITLSEL